MLVKRQKTSIFIDAKQEWTVLNVKKMLEGIVKKTPEELRLLHRDEIMEDDKKLVDLGLTDQTTKPQSPAVIGLVYKISGILKLFFFEFFYLVCKLSKIALVQKVNFCKTVLKRSTELKDPRQISFLILRGLE